MDRTPWIVLAIGACLMGYAFAHTDVLVCGHLITQPVVFAFGMLIAVLAAGELLADSELSERW